MSLGPFALNKLRALISTVTSPNFILEASKSFMSFLRYSNHMPLFPWLLTLNAKGWYPTKSPMHCGHFLINCSSPSDFKSFLIHPLELSGKYQQTPCSEAEINIGEKCP
jgi:hypothetical protein